MLFEACTPLLEHVEPLLRHRCKALYLVGGMADSKYLQQRLRALLHQHAPSTVLVIPSAPSLAIVNGAVVQGLNHALRPVPPPQPAESAPAAATKPQPQAAAPIQRRAGFTIGCAVARPSPQVRQQSTVARADANRTEAQHADVLPAHVVRCVVVFLLSLVRAVPWLDSMRS